MAWYPTIARERRSSASRGKRKLEREAAKKFMGRVYRRVVTREQGRRGDLQIGARGGEGNCAEERAGVSCLMRAQMRQEAEQ